MKSRGCGYLSEPEFSGLLSELQIIRVVCDNLRFKLACKIEIDKRVHTMVQFNISECSYHRE